MMEVMQKRLIWRYYRFVCELFSTAGELGAEERGVV